MAPAPRAPLTPGLMVWAKSEKRICKLCGRVNVAFVNGAYAAHNVIAPGTGKTKGPCPVNEVMGLTRKPPPARRPKKPPPIAHYELPARPPKPAKKAPLTAAKADRLATMRELAKKRTAGS